MKIVFFRDGCKHFGIQNTLLSFLSISFFLRIFQLAYFMQEKVLLKQFCHNDDCAATETWVRVQTRKRLQTF